MLAFLFGIMYDYEVGFLTRLAGGVAKWLNAADCKSAPSGSAVRICPPPFFVFGL